MDVASKCVSPIVMDKGADLGRATIMDIASKCGSPIVNGQGDRARQSLNNLLLNQTRQLISIISALGHWPKFETSLGHIVSSRPG